MADLWVGFALRFATLVLNLQHIVAVAQVLPFAVLHLAVNGVITGHADGPAKRVQLAPLHQHEVHRALAIGLAAHRDIDAVVAHRHWTGVVEVALPVLWFGGILVQKLASPEISRWVVSANIMALAGLLTHLQRCEQ